MSPQQVRHIQRVPALVLGGPGGQTLYGTQAFEWLQQFQADVELEGFSGNGSLPFSDTTSATPYATYATVFSAFEPVP